MTLLISVALAAGAAPASAAWSNRTEITQPIDGWTQPGGVESARAPDARTLFVWTRFQGGCCQRLQGRIATPAGTGYTLGPITNLSPRTVGQDAGQPQVAVDDQGDFVITWMMGHLSTTYGIYARTWSRTNAIGPLRQVSPSNTYNVNPRLASGSLGRTVIAWTTCATDNSSCFAQDQPWKVRARIMSAAGALGSVRVISPPPTDNDFWSRDVDVDVDDQGNAVLAWVHQFIDGPNVAQAVEGTTLSASGVRGAVSRLSSSSEAFWPDVAVNSSGTGRVVWSRRRPAEPFGNDIVTETRTMSTAGDVGPGAQILSPLRGFADLPQVEIDDTGAAAVVWDRTASDPDYLQGRRIAADGTLSPLRTLTSKTRQADGDYEVEMAADGTALLAWHDGQTESGAGKGILTRKYFPDNTAGSVATAALGAADHDLAVAPDGSAAVSFAVPPGEFAQLEAVFGP